jgi:Glycosyl hydrolase family 3 C-terminal domain/Fibronectin type III-like domain
MRIDSHHHVWDLRARPQPWTKDLPALQRSFGIDELRPSLARHDIDATIAVQTVAVADETPELLALAASDPDIAGVVGWTDLTAPDIADRLAELITPELVAIRHLAQDEPDPYWLTRREVQAGIAAAVQLAWPTTCWSPRPSCQQLSKQSATIRTSGSCSTMAQSRSSRDLILERSDDPAPPGLPVTTVLDGLVKEFPAAGVRYEQGCGITGEDRSGFEAAVSAAAAADVTVLVVGDRSGMFGHGTSGEGCDVTGLALPGVQGDLADAVLAATRRTVLVVVSGRPYEVGRYAAQAGALVQAFLPGVEGPAAIAGVLSGRVNPSGHLPVQIPGEAAGQPATYLAPALALKTDGVSSVDPTPAFPFGHGLSYTSFAIDRASAAEPAVPTDGTIRVSATVSNTGSRDGATVLQLYLSDPVASVTRPVRQLIGFTRLGLAAGESAEACFEVHADLTSFTGRDLRRRVEPGMVVLTVAQSADDPGAPMPVTLTGETRIVDHTRTMTTQVRPENAGPGGVR